MYIFTVFFLKQQRKDEQYRQEQQHVDDELQTLEASRFVHARRGITQLDTRRDTLRLVRLSGY